MDRRELIEQITDEIWKRISAAPEGLSCSCHAVRTEECPNGIRIIVQCGADRIGLPLGSPSPGSDLASLIDHTLLKPEATRPQVTQLCREALEYGFAAVCVNPYWVRTCAALVKGSPVVVASVVGFPLGATTTDAKVYEARRALFDGAREIDMVINVGALKSHEDEAVRKDMEEVVRACHEADSQTKVILETALLTQEEKVRACVLAREAGADFVKTSTGFGPGGATAEDVALMRSVVGPGMGIKAAGGIKDYETAKRLVEAGATRIGASAGVRIVQQQAAPAATPY